MKVRRALLCAAIVSLAGCTIKIGGDPSTRRGELVRESRTIERAAAAKAELVRAELTMAAGKLEVTGGAKELLEATFEYNVPGWKPEVRYSSTGFRGQLTVQQNKPSASAGEARNNWNIKLANDIPLDIVVRCGAGESRLELGELNLRGVEVHMGAGAIDMDLRGKPTHDFAVTVHGGVGQARIRVPSDVGVIAEARGGLGSINVRGMKREGGAWVNEAYGKAKTTIRLDVKGGIGEIDIAAE